MSIFQWNAVRAGDHERAHADRVSALGRPIGFLAVVRPRGQAVYLVQGDAVSGCWRCEMPTGAMS